MLFQEPYSIYTFFGIFLFLFVVLEIILHFFGPSLSNFLDTDSTHFFDFEHNFDLNLFHFKGTPFSVILFFFSFIFVFSGYFFHYFFNLNQFFVLFASVFFALITTSKISIIWQKYIPEVESYAVKNEDFLTLIGKKINGNMTKDNSVQVKVIDKFGQTHYLNCKPADLNSTITGEKEVKIVGYRDGFYFVLET